MDKTRISSYLREHLDDIDKKKEPGPYITISRQYGCDGEELGHLLLEKLNKMDPEARWNFYYKELLRRLSEDTGLPQEFLEKERLAKSGVIKDFLRGLKRETIPDGLEIRNQITIMIRTIAFEGYAVILGQGAASATADISNGLSLRLEAPREWRIARISVREKLDKSSAAKKIEEVEEQRKHLRKIYEEQNPREPAFSLTIDNSIFSKELIAELVIQTLLNKGLIQEIQQI